MLVPATVGGALMTALISVLMTAFAIGRGLVDDLLLFPVGILSATLIATTAVLSVPQPPVVVVADFSAVLIIAGMTLVYLDRLVKLSSADALDNMHE